MTRIPHILVAVLITALLGACSINFTTTVNPDGSGEFGMEYVLTAEDKTTFSDMGMPLEDLCGTMQAQSSDLPMEFSFRQEEHSGETWCIAAIPFETLDELRQMLETDGDNSFKVNRLEIQGERFYFDVEANTGGDEMDSLGFGIDLDMNWKLTLPGAVGAHNANQVNGRTLIWDMPFGETILMRAESSTATLNLGMVLLLVLFGLMVAGAAVALIILLVKKPAPQEI